MCYTNSDLFFDNLKLKPNFSSLVSSYIKYWETIKPTEEESIFLRWLFAFTSIHTTWESNISAYNKIKDFSVWLNDKDLLKELLIESRAGLFNIRTETVWEFSKEYWKCPKNYMKQKNQSWSSYRNELTDKIKGIGLAKVSFTLEMLDPLNSEVVCLDTHMLQLYNNKNLRYKTVKGKEEYLVMENHWIKKCKGIDVPSCIARAIYWDQKQNQLDSRYWTYILES